MTTRKLDPEKMYNFKYTPKGLGTLNQYDRSPLIFILDIQGDTLLAVNIHWIEKGKRFQFIEDVKEIMGKTIGAGKRRERIRLFYTMLKKPKFKAGMLAVRRYIVANISNIVEVQKHKWDYVLGISSKWADIRRKENEYKKEKKEQPFLK